MCGIFLYISDKKDYDRNNEEFSKKIQHRGPDNSCNKKVNFNEKEIFMEFHRLSINGLDDNSNQPMEKDNVIILCNGEIYNYKNLIKEYNLEEEYKTKSDCEIILHLYLILNDVNLLLNKLDGVFSLFIIDKNKEDIIIARDHLGIRPLYIGDDNSFASEAKSLTFSKNLKQFPPRTFWRLKEKKFVNWYQIKIENYFNPDYEKVRETLINAVDKRLLSDRPIGCLLSGGLDSSLIASIISRKIKNLQTFSIGFEGSPDLYYAEKVAKFIKSQHRSFIVNPENFFEAIEDTIYTLGTYDITTVRASVGHRMICNYIRQNSDIKVLFSGETMDEMGGYLYLEKAPNEEDFQNECLSLLNNIHYFDGLRSDRCISCWGLESRVPFSDREFINCYMSIKPSERMFDKGKMEKYILRKSFQGYLPDEVLWRKKDGFSDSISKKDNSWHNIIKNMVDKLVTDEEFDNNSYTYNKPLTKEAYYYRKIFSKYYKNHDKICPYMWLPKWTKNTNDPSAREL